MISQVPRSNQIFRNIQIEMSNYLIDNGFDNWNIYIDPVENPNQPFIYIVDNGGNNLTFKNHVDINVNMQIICDIQIYNNNADEAINKSTGDDMYTIVDSFYNNLEDWFCRVDTVTYPYSKDVYAVDNIRREPLTITNEDTNETVRVYRYTIDFKYTMQKE